MWTSINSLALALLRQSVMGQPRGRAQLLVGGRAAQRCGLDCECDGCDAGCACPEKHRHEAEKEEKEAEGAGKVRHKGKL